MKGKRPVFGIGFFLVFMVAVAPAAASEPFAETGANVLFRTCQTTGQQRALKQRAETVTRARDDLISRTLRFYGGDFVKTGATAAIILNGKLYRDFTAEVIQGKYLRIETPEDTYYMEVVDQAPAR